jgi:hypothetical protein
MFPLSRIEPFSVPFPRKGLAKKRAFAKKTETTYVIKISKLYNWLFYVGREVSGSVYQNQGLLERSDWVKAVNIEMDYPWNVVCSARYPKILRRQDDVVFVTLSLPFRLHHFCRAK